MYVVTIVETRRGRYNNIINNLFKVGVQTLVAV